VVKDVRRELQEYCTKLGLFDLTEYRVIRWAVFLGPLLQTQFDARPSFTE
jgi:hypothetical protein